MTRYEANHLIFSDLRANLTNEALAAVDCKCTPETYLNHIDDIRELMNSEDGKDLRWTQMMWILDLNITSYGKRDRFYEESEVTLERLITLNENQKYAH